MDATVACLYSLRSISRPLYVQVTRMGEGMETVEHSSRTVPPMRPSWSAEDTIWGGLGGRGMLILIMF